MGEARWRSWVARQAASLRAVRLAAVMLPVGGVLLAAGLAWRWSLGPGGGVGDLDGAESVASLMVRTLSEGRWTGFHVWGAPTSAAVEVPLAALARLLGGDSLAVLRAVPFLASALVAMGCVGVAVRALGWCGGALAAGLTAVAFPEPSGLLARELGGLAFGVLAGMIGLGEASAVSVLVPRRSSIAAGLFAGLALAANPALAPFTVGALASVALGLSGVLREPSRVLIAFHHGLRFMVGLVVGAAPLWARQSTFQDPVGAAALAAGGIAPQAGRWATVAGGTQPLVLLGALLGLGVLGGAGRWVQRGNADRGVRLAGGVLVAALASGLGALMAPGDDDAPLRALALWACVPWLGALACLWRGTAVAAFAVSLALVARVDPSALPVSAEPGAGLPVASAADYLEARPGTQCYAPDGLAYRIARGLPPGRACIAVTGRDARPGWRVQAAAGPRAYFFPPDEVALLAAFDSALEQAQLPVRRDVAGPFFVRAVAGMAWPPEVPPVVWEHAKRDQRTTIDGNPASAATVPAGQALRMDLVWPTALQAVRLWLDVRALATAPCSLRAGVRLADGAEDWGAPVDLRDACRLARAWALLPSGSLEVRLPVPRREAVAILVQSLDRHSGAALAASEIRVVPLEADTPLGRLPSGR